MLTCEVISDPTAFAALKDDWNALADRFGNPLYRFEWFDAGWKAFGSGRTLAVFVVRDQAKVRAIAPLMVERTFGIPRLVIIGNETAEPNALLYDDEAALACLTSAIFRRGLPLWLRRIRDASPEMLALRSRPIGQQGVLLVNPSNTATARIPLTSTWGEFEKLMSNRELSKLRRLRKLANNEGGVKFQCVIPNEATLDQHLQETIQVESSGWKSRAGTSIRSNPNILRFVTEIALTASRDRSLYLFTLRIGEATAATQMAISHSRGLWFIKQGYDERWAKCAPGIVLTHEILRYAVEQGFSSCDFLGRFELWQKRWPAELQRYTAIRYYPVSVSGGCLLVADACSRFNRVLRSKLSFQRSRFLEADEIRSAPRAGPPAS